MIITGQDNTKRVVIDTCNCGCGSEIQITKDIDPDIRPEDQLYYISLHSSKFDEEQLGIFSIIGRRLKRAWFNLLGKDYLYMDIVMTSKQFNSFSKAIDDLNK